MINYKMSSADNISISETTHTESITSDTKEDVKSEIKMEEVIPEQAKSTNTVDNKVEYAENSLFCCCNRPKQQSPQKNNNENLEIKISEVKSNSLIENKEITPDDGCCFGENGVCSCIVCDDEGYCGPNVDSNSNHGIFECKRNCGCFSTWMSLILITVGAMLGLAIIGVAAYASYEEDLALILPYNVAISSAVLLIVGAIVKIIGLLLTMQQYDEHIHDDKQWYNALVSMVNEELPKEIHNDLRKDNNLPDDFKFKEATDITLWSKALVKLLYIGGIGGAFITTGLITMLAPGLIIYSILFTFFGSFICFFVCLGIQSLYSTSVKNRDTKSENLRTLARELNCPALKLAERHFSRIKKCVIPKKDPTDDQICVALHSSIEQKQHSQ